MKSWWRWWTLGLITAGGVLLRAYHLSARSLWFDESFTWRLLQFPIRDIIIRTANDVHPPLYYLVLKLWTVFQGSTVVGLRSFSVFCAGVAIVMAYVVARELFHSREAGLIAALLLAFSAWQIPISWEARMYTFGIVLVLVSVWLLLKALRTSTSKLAWWVAYGVCVAAMAYTHYYLLFTICGELLWLACYLFIKHRWNWQIITGGVVAAGLFLPWLPTFIAQNQRVQDSFWIPKATAWSVPQTFYQMATAAGLNPDSFLNKLILTSLALLVVVGWVVLVRRRPLASLLLAGFATPFICSLLLSWLHQSVYQDRYFVFAHTLGIVALAGLLSLLPVPLWRRIGIAALALFSLVAFLRHWHELDIAHKPGAHGALAYVAQQDTTAAPLLVGSPFLFFVIDHYAHEEFLSLGIPKFYTTSTEVVHFAGGPIFTSVDMSSPADVEALSATELWLIDTTGFGGTPSQLPTNWVETSQRLFPEVYGYQGEIIVRKFQKKP